MNRLGRWPFLLGLIVTIACNGGAASQRISVSGGGDMVGLTIAGPDRAPSNSVVDLDVSIRAESLDIVPFLVGADGCSVALIGSETPVRLSTLRPDVAGALDDPFVPQSRTLALDANGHLNTTVKVAIGSLDAAIPGPAGQGRQCVLDVQVTGYADATFRIAVTR